MLQIRPASVRSCQAYQCNWSAAGARTAARYAAQQIVLPPSQARSEQGAWNAQHLEMTPAAVCGIQSIGQGHDVASPSPSTISRPVARYRAARPDLLPAQGLRSGRPSGMSAGSACLASGPTRAEFRVVPAASGRSRSDRCLLLGIVADPKTFEKLAKRTRRSCSGVSSSARRNIPVAAGREPSRNSDVTVRGGLKSRMASAISPGEDTGLRHLSLLAPLRFNAGKKIPMSPQSLPHVAAFQETRQRCL